jgi:hypothetical protein
VDLTLILLTLLGIEVLLLPLLHDRLLSIFGILLLLVLGSTMSSLINLSFLWSTFLDLFHNRVSLLLITSIYYYLTTVL